ncbi:hypothetical protein BDZ89DRAFT_1050327 [Hymenopellis radicata]|nr:hypothetical protein BDZ89DRAFT_1050327 [Hymenopellis radicata]
MAAMKTNKLKTVTLSLDIIAGNLFISDDESTETTGDVLLQPCQQATSARKSPTTRNVTKGLEAGVDSLKSGSLIPVRHPSSRYGSVDSEQDNVVGPEGRDDPNSSQNELVWGMDGERDLTSIHILLCSSPSPSSPPSSVIISSVRPSSSPPQTDVMTEGAEKKWFSAWRASQLATVVARIWVRRDVRRDLGMLLGLGAVTFGGVALGVAAHLGAVDRAVQERRKATPQLATRGATALDPNSNHPDAVKEAEDEAEKINVLVGADPIYTLPVSHVDYHPCIIPMLSVDVAVASVGTCCLPPDATTTRLGRCGETVAYEARAVVIILTLVSTNTLSYDYALARSVPSFIAYDAFARWSDDGTGDPSSDQPLFVVVVCHLPPPSSPMLGTVAAASYSLSPRSCYACPQYPLDDRAATRKPCQNRLHLYDVRSVHLGKVGVKQRLASLHPTSGLCESESWRNERCAVCRRAASQLETSTSQRITRVYPYSIRSGISEIRSV